MKIGLTGSRLFGSARENSDTDFFVQDSPEVRHRLLSAGFRQLRITGKGGPNMTAVFRKGKVDVATQADFARKEWENRIMCITPLRQLLKHLPKPARDNVWGKVQKL